MITYDQARALKKDLDDQISGPWTDDLVALLQYLVVSMMEQQQTLSCDFPNSIWEEVAANIPSKTGHQCKLQWNAIQDRKTIKAMWTQIEDDALVRLVKEYGVQKWARLAKHLNREINAMKTQGSIDQTEMVFERNGKQCRERWLNALNPTINKGDWTLEEDIDFLKKWLKIGNQWKNIADLIHGRTESQVKNRFKLIMRHNGLEKFKSDYTILK